MIDAMTEYLQQQDNFDVQDYTENDSLNDNFFGQGYFEDDVLEYTHAF